MITTADVETNLNGAILTKDEQQLFLQVLSPEKYEIKVVSLDPPPLSYDKKIENLKRIEVRIAPSAFENDSGEIVVDLSGN